MPTVGVFEAKTRLSELLERVAAGEEITITRRGQPIARLVPATERSAETVRRAIEEMQAFSKGRRLGNLGWKTLRDTGRKW